MATRRGTTMMAEYGAGHRDAAPPQLPSHILQALHRHMRASLFNSTCADIRMRAFGRTYALHRVFLVQSTFFHSLLDGEFQEAQLGLGVWRSGDSGQSTSAAANVMELHFDDPNITRPAFEYCIAALYGSAPQLVLPAWSSPSPSHPLTTAYEADRLFPAGNDPTSGRDDLSDDEEDGEGKADDSTESSSFNTRGPQHPATPRFLLSLLATAKYLGIPSVATQAVTLILCSITPFTASHYLRFSLGYGIHGAMEAKERRSTAKSTRWDWELEGPAWGLASLALEDAMLDGQGGPDIISSLSEEAQRLSLTQPDASSRSKQSTSSVEDESTLEYQTSLQGFYYGAQADKIGEACSCWLLRWGTSVLDVEEKLHAESKVRLADASLLPFGQMPVNHTLTSTDYPARVASLLPAPSHAVWRHPKLGGIPARWVRATIASDSFWVNEEWNRYDTARRIVSMRRAHLYGSRRASRSHEGGEDDMDVKQTGDESAEENKRSQGVSGEGEQHAEDDTDDEEADEEERDEAEYTLLFSEGIYYTHMSFGRLSVISNDVCPHTGLPYAPMHVLQNALWTQSELKSVILSKNPQCAPATSAQNGGENEENSAEPSRDEPAAPHRGSPTDAAAEGPAADTVPPQDEEADRELGLVSSDADFVKAQSSLGKRGRRSRVGSSLLGDDGRPMKLGGMKPLMLLASPPSSSALGSVGAALEGLLMKRFYAIPVDDTVRVGESLATLAAATAAAAQHPNGLIYPELGSNSSDGPTGVASASDPHALASSGSPGNSKRHDAKNFFGLENAVKRGNRIVISEADGSGDGASSDAEDSKQRPLHQWTGFEPMRIGVEFHDVDRLSEKQRLYSPSFFYAGSVWNLYVQTVKKTKGLQLGVYLHRQNYNDGLPNPSAPLRPSPSAWHDRRRQRPAAPSTGGGAHDGSTGLNNPQTPQRVGAMMHESGHGVSSLSHESVFYDNILTGARQTSTIRQRPANATAAQTQASNGLTTPARLAAAAHVVSPYSLTPSPMASSRQAGGGSGNGIAGDVDPYMFRRAPFADLDDLENMARFGPSAGTAASAASGSLPLDVPYLDERRYLRAYFAIHCPSPMGTSLTRFSSRPDNFTLSQSWGWKSSSLLGAVHLEDGVLGTAKSQVSQIFRCVVTMGVV